VRELFGREPNTSQNPDEAIALGATIQAGILSGSLRQVLLLDVTPLSLGIETFGGLMNIIIPRNTTIPAKAGEMFTNAVANQDAMLIRILQGERELAKDNWELGRIEVPFPPGPKGSARVGVQFSLDADGILHVLARDTATNTDTTLEIRGTAIDVEDERVEQMIAESVDFAFEDMNERIWTEAKLKAEELLPAVEAALTQLGDSISRRRAQNVRRPRRRGPPAARITRSRRQSPQSRHPAARRRHANPRRNADRPCDGGITRSPRDRLKIILIAHRLLTAEEKKRHDKPKKTNNKVKERVRCRVSARPCASCFFFFCLRCSSRRSRMCSSCSRMIMAVRI
jgi:hypothetical protein